MTARAEIEITASDSKLADGLIRARRTVLDWSSAIARGTSSTFNSMMKELNKSVGSLKPGDTFKHAIGTFAGNMMTKGVTSLEEAATGVRDFERDLVRFQIVANKTPEQMLAFRSSVRAVSKETGIAADQVLAGAQTYVDLTGDVDGANTSMRQFARIAQASGSDINDVANAAASMGDAMHVSPGELEATFSGLINQGKAGAVTLKNMAGEFPSLLSKVARFGVVGKEGTLELGAMFQVVRKGFGSAEEASTGLQAMLAGMIKHADRFEKAGVKVFDIGKDGTKTLRPVSKILEEIGTSKLAKDPQLLNKAFGRGEGEQAYQMLKGHVDMLHQMEEAGKDAGAVQRDLATYTTSAAGRIDVALNSAKNKLAEVFTPERIERFAGALEKAVGVLDHALKLIGEVSDFIDKMSPKSKDEQISDAMAKGKGGNATYKEMLADQLDQEAAPGEALYGEKGLASFNDSWSGDLLKLTGTQPLIGMDYSRVDGSAQRAAASKLRVAARDQRNGAMRDAMFAGVAGGDSWAGDGFSGGPSSLTAGGFAPAPVDQAAFLASLQKAITDAIRSAPPVVKLGDNQVAQSAAKATKGRNTP